MEKQEISDAPVTRSFQPDPEDDDVRIRRWPYPISSPFRSFSYFASTWMTQSRIVPRNVACPLFFFIITLSNELRWNFFLAFRLDIFRFVIFPCQFRRFDASCFENNFDIYMLYRGICLFDYIYQQRGFSFVFFFLKENRSNFKLEGMLKPSHTISTLVPDK